MNDTGSSNGTSSPEYDAVIVGGSLAGCTTAILLGREGLRVALVEKQPDPAAFKRVCSHFIQASAVPTLERLDLLDPIVAAGGQRSRIQAWTEWGWIKPPPDEASLGVNLRREVLDPMVREAAAGTPGVDLHLGQTTTGLLRDGDTVSGVMVRDRDGAESALTSKLVVGADGRDSQIAELAGVKEKVRPTRAFRLRGLLRRADCPTTRPTARSGSWTRTGRRPSPPTATSSSTRRCRPRSCCPSSNATRPRR